MSRKLLPLLAVLALVGAGCSTDDAVERDVEQAAPEVRQEAEEAGRDLEEAAPGDVDDEGR
jgi:predicted small secreted protein